MTAAVRNSYGQMSGREVVGLFEPFVVGQLAVRRLADDALVLPAKRLRLLSPQPALISLHLAKPPLGAGFLDDIELYVRPRGRPRTGPGARRMSAPCAGSAGRAC